MLIAFCFREADGGEVVGGIAGWGAASLGLVSR